MVPLPYQCVEDSVTITRLPLCEAVTVAPLPRPDSTWDGRDWFWSSVPLSFSEVRSPLDWLIRNVRPAPVSTVKNPPPLVNPNAASAAGGPEIPPATAELANAPPISSARRRRTTMSLSPWLPWFVYEGHGRYQGSGDPASSERPRAVYPWNWSCGPKPGGGIMGSVNGGVTSSNGSTAFHTDQYEVGNLQGALHSGVAGRRAVFEVFARRLPPGRRYGVFCGL